MRDDNILFETRKKICVKQCAQIQQFFITIHRSYQVVNVPYTNVPIYIFFFISVYYYDN